METVQKYVAPELFLAPPAFMDDHDLSWTREGEQLISRRQLAARLHVKTRPHGRVLRFPEEKCL